VGNRRLNKEQMLGLFRTPVWKYGFPAIFHLKEANRTLK